MWDSDPHKGRFGGSSRANGRELRATITPASATDAALCHVQITVQATPGSSPLSDPVVLHLHPTFHPDSVSVTPSEGIARLDRLARGAFTVGVEADEGRTRLELDLAEQPDAPLDFRNA
jgi:hypothetical protein